jgi:hypothetical protein
MRSTLLALAILATLAVAAQAQIWIMSPANQMPSHKSGVAPVCSGVIDASAGCPLPMLGS